MSAPTLTAADRAEARCIWMQAGVVRRKICRKQFECRDCRYDLALRRVARENENRRLHGNPLSGRRAAIVSWQEKLNRLPLYKRPCLHHLKNRIAFRVCTNDYLCGNCDFDQFFNDQFTVFAAVRPVSALNIHGVRLPQGVYLHAGHCWVSLEEEEMVRIGLDDFSLRVLAPLDRVEAPLIGPACGQRRHLRIFVKPPQGNDDGQVEGRRQQDFQRHADPEQNEQPHGARRKRPGDGLSQVGDSGIARQDDHQHDEDRCRGLEDFQDDVTLQNQRFALPCQSHPAFFAGSDIPDNIPITGGIDVHGCFRKRHHHDAHPKPHPPGNMLQCIIQG